MKIGIIIPCFNEENYIGELLTSLSRSILDYQKPENIGVYICDNGSTDNTVKVIDEFINKLPSLTVLHEPEKGDGLAMLKAAKVAFESADWIISVDADCIVPISFIEKWVDAINKTSLPILTGYFKFPEVFHNDFPNASMLLKGTSPFNNLIKSIFGIINICGANHAISKKFYYKTGGYSQPFIIENKEKKLIAGNDWDLGVKARILNQKIGYVDVYNITSDRRASIDVKSFVLGTAYEGVFESYRKRIKGEDIISDEMTEIKVGNKLRTVKHYALKPILADRSVLDKSQTIEVLGQELITEIKNWISATEIKDINNDRNGFIYGTLEGFHKIFGVKVYQKIEEASEK